MSSEDDATKSGALRSPHSPVCATTLRAVRRTRSSQLPSCGGSL
jgi:hypothetical protein